MIEPLVLLPGITSDIRLFLPQILAFGKERAVITVPTTQAERIDDIAIDMLASLPPKFALLGHGFGGMVALELIRRAPERVTRIALCATTPLNETPQEAATREMRIVAARAGRFEDALAQEFPLEAIASGDGRKPTHDKVMVMARANGPELYVRQCRAMQRRRDQQSTLRRIKQPAAIICGAEDGLIPVKRHEFMASLIPYAQFAVIEGAGHFPSLEQPTKFNEQISSWIKQPLVLR